MKMDEIPHAEQVSGTPLANERVLEISHIQKQAKMESQSRPKKHVYKYKQYSTMIIKMGSVPNLWVYILWALPLPTV